MEEIILKKVIADRISWIVLQGRGKGSQTIELLTQPHPLERFMVHFAHKYQEGHTILKMQFLKEDENV